MKKKNILVIMADQLRADCADTPNIKRIAEGMTFACCQSPNPICAPARTAMATGRYTRQIGTLAMLGDLHPQMRTYMNVLQEHGYYTAAAGKLHFLQPWPWDTKRGKVLDLTKLKESMKSYGFDEIAECAGKQLMLRNYCDYSAYLEGKGKLKSYLDFVEAAGENSSSPQSPESECSPFPFEEEDYIDHWIGEQSLELLKKRPKDRPFYLFTSFCGPHKPFDPPKRWLEKIPYEERDDFIAGENMLSQEEKRRLWKKRQAYRAMVLFIDHQIGRILDYLGEECLLEDTVIFFTSDHGEMMGDHGLLQKGVPWKEASTVPLLISHPDYRSQALCNTPVSLIDVAATIQDVAGIPVEGLRQKSQAFSGRIPSKSLMPVISGQKKSVREYTFTEFDSKWQMLQTSDWKYVKWIQTESPDEKREELYNRKEDPDELENLAAWREVESVLNWFRNRREYLTDNTPPCQTCWAPISPDAERTKR